jgi:hypothetical protein
MPCIKTGALVFFPQYQAASRGDLFEFRSMQILHGTERIYELTGLETIHAIAYITHEFKTEPYRVYILEYVVNLEYNGKPLKSIAQWSVA